MTAHNFCTLTSKGGVVLGGGTPFEIEVQQSSSKVRFSDQVEIDCHITCMLFILHCNEPPHATTLY
jgi:hypothetical protein